MYSQNITKHLLLSCVACYRRGYRTRQFSRRLEKKRKRKQEQGATFGRYDDDGDDDDSGDYDDDRTRVKEEELFG